MIKCNERCALVPQRVTTRKQSRWLCRLRQLAIGARIARHRAENGCNASGVPISNDVQPTWMATSGPGTNLGTALQKISRQCVLYLDTSAIVCLDTKVNWARVDGWSWGDDRDARIRNQLSGVQNSKQSRNVWTPSGPGICHLQTMRSTEQHERSSMPDSMPAMRETCQQCACATLCTTDLLIHLSINAPL